jgi:transcriptional regulator
VYVPPAFAVTDTARLHDFLERNSFATLVTRHADGRMVAGHVPLLLVRDSSPFGRLEGHVARANDQWRDVTGDALAIFTGPHAYVSPRWYEADEVVPTWNYVAVHAYGPLEVMRDRVELLALLRRSLSTFEAGAETPWTLERSGVAAERRLGAIVGFRIPIARLEGKWKLNQNHPAERQERVIAALEAQGGEDAREIAAMMRENLGRGA